jgi:uncharacterized phage protein (predicted DNA packaging)
MITLTNFTELKVWLRIDSADDDAVLSLLLNSAKSYLEGAGIPELEITDQNLDLYKQALLIYIEMKYDTDERKINKLEKSFQSILLQLRAGLIVIE